jgi:hypothetical protein
MVRVRIRPYVLESDEVIVAVLAHEMHEINALRQMLALKVMTAAEFNEITNPSGTLHREAWRAGLDLIIRRMRGTP